MALGGNPLPISPIRIPPVCTISLICTVWLLGVTLSLYLPLEFQHPVPSTSSRHEKSLSLDLCCQETEHHPLRRRAHILTLASFIVAMVNRLGCIVISCCHHHGCITEICLFLNEICVWKRNIRCPFEGVSQLRLGLSNASTF